MLTVESHHILRQGQRKGKRRPLPRFAVDPDPLSVGLEDHTTERQPQPGTVTLLLTGHKFLKELRPNILGNARPAVRDRHHHLGHPLVREARARADGGEAGHVLEDVAFLYCDAADTTVRAFLSYYGEDEGVDALDLVAELSLPTIVIAGSEDPLTTSLAPEGEALARAGRITFVNVDGADHFFRDLYAYDTVEAVVGWLNEEGQD